MDEISKYTAPHRAQWKTRMGFIFAAIGSAIGLGNIWRFPYLCYENGGGAFLIPYLVALVVAGIPLMILEIGIGQRMRGSAPMSFAKINKHWEWLGWWAVNFVMLGIVLYYSVIISWCLNYLFFSFNLSWGSNPNDFFFKEFLQISSGPGAIGDVRGPILLSLIVIWFLNWIIVFFGVQRGVERANRIFMPLLLVLTTILVIWSLTLKGAMGGIKWYLKPDFSVLSHPKVWIDAFSQIFFTLSIGFGIMIAYASYLPRKTEVVKDAFIVSFGNCFYSIFAGFAVFGVLGYMSASTGKPFSEVVQQSIGLAFVAYPQAISLMPAFSKIFGILFFATLVVAGLSSSISILEAFTSAIIDKFHYRRKVVVTVFSIVGFLGSIVFATRGGLFWLDIVDHFLTHYGLVVVGILECILIGWIFKASRLREHINNVATFTIGKWWDICIRFITPMMLILILINDLVKEIRVPYGGYSWLANILIGRDWLLATLFAALIVANHPWRIDIHAEERKEK
ncbi:MAG: sodium-dependent transporter [Candidatus Omnitrophica bacterium]|nr:sodium-dependent transporter [Candidatus Omnitrophota bacterium]